MVIRRPRRDNHQSVTFLWRRPGRLGLPIARENGKLGAT
jgi:hypothetical protein